MKKIFAILSACTMAAICLSSCQKEQGIKSADSQQGRHKVTFNINMVEAETRTGLELQIVQNWKNTENENVHLFESHLTSVIKGENNAIETPIDDSYRKAHFSAEFNQEVIATIENINGYRYGALVAQKSDDNFIVPAVQYPEEETLIDPDADFLIGDSQQEFEETKSGQTIDLYFKRPVALSRLAITNMEGEKVEWVEITADNFLTGFVPFSGVDFAAGTAAFDGTDANKTLRIQYPEGGVDMESTFYAYFVSLAGTKHINSIKVGTDQWVYTKTVGKNTTFSANAFKNIACDLTVKAGVTRVPAHTTVTKFYKASVIEDGYAYLIVSNNKAVKRNVGAVDAADVTISDDMIEITGDVDDLLWTASAETVSSTYGQHMFKNDSYYLGREGGGDVDYNPLILKQTEPDKYFTWDYTGEAVLQTNSSYRQYIYFGEYDSQTKFWARRVKGETPVYNGYLFNTRLPQTLTFNPTTATIDNTSQSSFVAPVLNGAETAVTYTSGDESIATITPEGVVTPVSNGTVTITATASGSSQYQSAKATYELTVTGVAQKYYVKVTGNEIVDGTYLIVYSGSSSKYALDASHSSSYRKSVTVENNKILATAELAVANVEITSKGGKYFLKSTEGYIYNNSDSKLSFSSTQNDDYLHTGTISSGDVTFTNKGANSSTKNLRYNSGFSYGSSSTLNLYLLEESSN